MPKTITDAKRLKNQLKEIRREGVAYDDEEHEIGIRNVAVPVTNCNSSIGVAIGVQGPSVRLSLDRMKEVAPILKKYASDISKVLGYQKSNFT